MKAAFQCAVRQFGIAPSEFWRMRPRDFWWLVEAAQDDGTKRGRRLSDADRRSIMDMLDGNEKPGGFW